MTNFGYYVRWKHLSQGTRLKEFALAVGLSPRRVLQIQGKTPRITDLPEGTAHRIALALGMTYEELERDSSTVLVPVPRFKDTGPKPLLKMIPGIRSGDQVERQKRPAASASPAAREKMKRKGTPGE